MIAAGIALLPDRYPTSLKTIESLLPQVDAILLSLNGFNSIPEGLVHPKIEVRYMGVNLGDIGKFHEWDGDFISCDDDLIYPGTYVEDFQTSKHRDTILTHHGSTFSAPVANWFKAKAEDPNSVRCLSSNRREQEVKVPGTGVSFYPSSLYSSVYEFVKESNEYNCQDMVVGAWLKKEGRLAIAMKHSRSYFGYTHPKETIWEETTQDRVKQTDKFNRILS